jgi:hypothetical protein
VTRRKGVYTVWDYGAMEPIEITFLKRTATLREPASGLRARYQVEVGGG